MTGRIRDKSVNTTGSVDQIAAFVPIPCGNRQGGTSWSHVA